jgi:hypothetical protein
MAQSHVLYALRRKYAKTLGELKAAHADRVRLMSELNHLGAVIRLFDPGADVEAIAPIRPLVNRRGRNGGMWTRMALDVLRQADRPMTGREIARLIMRRQEITDPKTMASIECSLQVTLERREGQGVLRAEGSPKRWSVG